MDDKIIRVKMVETLLSDAGSLYSPEKFSGVLEIPSQRALANMQYLYKEKYVEGYFFLGGDFAVSTNSRTAAYLAVPDAAKGVTHINISGSQNIVSGGDMSINNSDVLNTSAIPKEFEVELSDLVKEIKNASSPKDTQASKVKDFLLKVAASSASSAVASCAVSIFKAAIGLG